MLNAWRARRLPLLLRGADSMRHRAVRRAREAGLAWGVVLVLLASVSGCFSVAGTPSQLHVTPTGYHSAHQPPAENQIFPNHPELSIHPVCDPKNPILVTKDGGRTHQPCNAPMTSTTSLTGGEMAMTPRMMERAAAASRTCQASCVKSDGTNGPYVSKPCNTTLWEACP
jgi:hypothetical protein